jgi:E3 ubiquitin-protein ligase HERC4
MIFSFSWGSDEYGQLGHNQGAQTLRVPRLVKSLGTLKVTAIAAGMYHSAALTANGQLFTWGSNNKGQLGLGNKYEMVFSPTLVDCLAGVPLAGLVCGANHSIVASVSGAVFAWGANSHGQLGLGDSEDRLVPTQVRTLRTQRIAYSGLEAGSEHSVALTVDGGVFSWGSSRCGQLGHGSANKESMPRRIMELMGTVVSQVAAGDRHTLALVPSRNKLYAFGVGGSGQLGRGLVSMDNAALPQVVQGGDTFDTETISLIAAGGNTSWAVTSSKSQGRQQQSPAVSLLTSASLDKVGSVAEDELIDQDLMQDLETVFSSLACLNGSLLSTDHYGCRGTNPGVDLAAWRSAFATIAKCAHDSVPSLVLSGLLTVMEQLRASPPDVEALRFYLILPLHPAMQDPANAKEFHIPFAERLLRLQGPALKVSG